VHGNDFPNVQRAVRRRRIVAFHVVERGPDGVGVGNFDELAPGPLARRGHGGRVGAHVEQRRFDPATATADDAILEAEPLPAIEARHQRPVEEGQHQDGGILVDRNEKDTWILGLKGFFNP
jgi:hypothetical protein